MNRADLQTLSNLRETEARALLRAGHAQGAYYLAGYSVECALKSCVAKQTRRHDFPDRALAQQAHTHDLERLVRVAGLEPQLRRDLATNSNLQLNWAVVKDWTEKSRYDPGIGRAAAKDLISACTARKHGVLPWIRARW